MALLFILLVIAGGMGLSVEAGLLGPLASQVGDLWATMSIFGIGAVLTFSDALSARVAARRSFLCPAGNSPAVCWGRGTW